MKMVIVIMLAMLVGCATVPVKSVTVRAMPETEKYEVSVEFCSSY